MTPPQGPVLPWHRRLEARVAAALALMMAAVISAVLFIAVRQVSEEARERAASELSAARALFYTYMENRMQTGLGMAQLITQLPVFRAHLTDARLALHEPTITAMVDGYRRELDASFLVVTSPDGVWLANPGWANKPDDAPDELAEAVKAAAAGHTRGGLIEHAGELFLVVTTPVLFVDEVLGTLSAGYALTDEVARSMAQLAHCDVLFLWGSKPVAASLPDPASLDIEGFSARAASAGFGVLNERLRTGAHEYVAGTFGLTRDADASSPGRLVLLADWQPTQQFADQLLGSVLAGGGTVLGIALLVALAFSRRVTRPLRDIAAAAADVAAGNLALRLPVRGSAEVATVANAFNDMSASLRTARDRLMHDAIHDHLTQLPNRMLFAERLDRELARRVRHRDYQFAVLFIDLDRFKHVNDSLGHAAGDTLLMAFAQRLSGAVRRHDLVTRPRPQYVDAGEEYTLARYGGDEFVILLDDLRQPTDAVRVAERIQQLAAQPIVVDGHEVFAAASIGVAVCSPDHQSSEEILRDADIAMYRAKQAGGGSYAVFDAAMHREAAELLRLETDLRRAVERHEFRIHYQPMVSLKTGETTGYEALIRWQHPIRGLLAPAAFLQVAEELGLITTLDELVPAEACRQGAEWERAAPGGEGLTMSVNLSAKSLASEKLVARVTEALASTQFPPRALRLEITESVAVSDPERVQTVLRELRQLGIRVSLDDFGTGYCSLSYLQQFPADLLKVDRTFVARVDDEGGRQILRLIVNLAQTLGLEVVAEGAETHAQVEFLAALGCDHAQGYYFAEPLEARSITSRPSASSRGYCPS
jgi:diguanylate cyclase (GGDEF)-like protein